MALLSIQERVKRLQRIDDIKTEIDYYTKAKKINPKFAPFYNGKITELEDELKFI
jgi:hypothetical protein